MFLISYEFLDRLFVVCVRCLSGIWMARDSGLGIHILHVMAFGVSFVFKGSLW